MIRKSGTLRWPVVALAVVMALSSAAFARGEDSGSDTALSLRPLTALAGEDSGTALWDPVFKRTLQLFFPPDVTSDFLLLTAPVSFVLEEAIALSTASPNIQAHQDRFLILQGCRPHNCGNTKGIIVVDTETGDVCAALYRASIESTHLIYTSPLPDRPTLDIEAEIFIPAPTGDTSLLIDLCAEHFALATQRRVYDGFWINQSDVRVRVAPEFRVDPALAARFPVWNGLPQPY